LRAAAWGEALTTRENGGLLCLFRDAPRAAQRRSRRCHGGPAGRQLQQLGVEPGDKFQVGPQGNLDGNVPVGMPDRDLPARRHLLALHGCGLPVPARLPLFFRNRSRTGRRGQSHFRGDKVLSGKQSPPRRENWDSPPVNGCVFPDTNSIRRTGSNGFGSFSEGEKKRPEELKLLRRARLEAELVGPATFAAGSVVGPTSPNPTSACRPSSSPGPPCVHPPSSPDRPPLASPASSSSSR